MAVGGGVGRSRPSSVSLARRLPVRTSGHLVVRRSHPSLPAWASRPWGAWAELRGNVLLLYETENVTGGSGGGGVPVPPPTPGLAGAGAAAAGRRVGRTGGDGGGGSVVGGGFASAATLMDAPAASQVSGAALSLTGGYRGAAAAAVGPDGTRDPAAVAAAAAATKREPTLAVCLAGATLRDGGEGAAAGGGAAGGGRPRKGGRLDGRRCKEGLGDGGGGGRRLRAVLRRGRALLSGESTSAGSPTGGHGGGGGGDAAGAVTLTLRLADPASARRPGAAGFSNGSCADGSGWAAPPGGGGRLFELSPTDLSLTFTSELRAFGWAGALRAALAPTTVSMADFYMECAIGRGGDGRVFLVRHLLTREPLAMKVMPKPDASDEVAVRRALDERLILQYVARTHPHLVTLRYAFQSDDQLYLLTEFCEGGDLASILARQPLQRISETATRLVLSQLVAALGALHAAGVVYRDLKGANVMLHSDGRLRLIDFGLAKLLPGGATGRTTSFCGTRDHLPPAVVGRKAYGIEEDAYCLGVLGYQCLTGRVPFPGGKGLSRSQLYHRILHAPIVWPSHLSATAVSLLGGLLERDTERRLTLAQARAHPFFDGIDWAPLDADVAPVTTEQPPVVDVSAVDGDAAASDASMPRPMSERTMFRAVSATTVDSHRSGGGEEASESGGGTTPPASPARRPRPTIRTTSIASTIGRTTSGMSSADVPTVDVDPLSCGGGLGGWGPHETARRVLSHSALDRPSYGALSSSIVSGGTGGGRSGLLGSAAASGDVDAPPSPASPGGDGGVGGSGGAPPPPPLLLRSLSCRLDSVDLSSFAVNKYAHLRVDEEESWRRAQQKARRRGRTTRGHGRYPAFLGYEAASPRPPRTPRSAPTPLQVALGAGGLGKALTPADVAAVLRTHSALVLAEAGGRSPPLGVAPAAAAAAADGAPRAGGAAAAAAPGATPVVASVTAATAGRRSPAAAAADGVAAAARAIAMPAAGGEAKRSYGSSSHCGSSMGSSLTVGGAAGSAPASPVPIDTGTGGGTATAGSATGPAGGGGRLPRGVATAAAAAVVATAAPRRKATPAEPRRRTRAVAPSRG